jgi:CDP-diacylglycerol--serine O-phosphatidyltransferase
MAGRPISLLPNLVTLANAFFGLLALSKAIDALILSGDDPTVFYQKMDRACFYVFVGMICDGLDGLVARLTRGESAFGAQLDSFSDALTFGVVPALLVKVLVEHEGGLTGHAGNPRLHFLASASFALMAILRLVRFNLEPDEEKTGEEKTGEVKTFRGLPSPAAAGMVVSTIWLYLVMRQPSLEKEEGTSTFFHRALSFMEAPYWEPILDWVPVLLACALPILGFLMVSNVRYVHTISYLMLPRSQFFTLVGIVFLLILFYMAPVLFLFLFAAGFTLSGFVLQGLARLRLIRAPSPRA